MSFYMVAGTVEWERGREELLQALTGQGIGARLDEDEDELQWDEGEVELVLRPGFEHEWILVGSAADETVLMAALHRLIDAFQARGIALECEIHAPDNRQIGVLRCP